MTVSTAGRSSSTTRAASARARRSRISSLAVAPPRPLPRLALQQADRARHLDQRLHARAGWGTARIAGRRDGEARADGHLVVERDQVRADNGELNGVAARPQRQPLEATGDGAA